MATSSDKYDRILDAALRVFAQKGFYNTKVSEVAREAGVADGTIYNYFKSKDDILIMLFEERMDWILERLRSELTGDVEVQIRRFIELHLNLAEVSPDLAEFITVELRQSDKFLRDYANDKFAEYLSVLSGLIERGQAESVFRAEIDARLASRAMFGSLDEILLTLTLQSRARSIDASNTARQVADLFLAGLRI